MARAQKTLKAVLFADLEGYSFRVGRDEDDTLGFMERCFALFRNSSAAYGGDLVKTTGDGVVLQFDTATDAVAYAVEVRGRISSMQSESGDEALFRMGIHLGEVQRTANDIYGHAVNVAARLQQLAQPGDICVSQDVYRHAARSGVCSFAASGTPYLKNIAERIPVYRVLDDEPEDKLLRSAAGRILISVIDGLALVQHDQDVTRLRSSQAKAVLGYLALSSRLREVQDRLAALIWPERPIVAARRALAQAVRTARNAIEPVAPGALQREGDRVALLPALVEVDIARIHRDVTVGQIDDFLLERGDWPDMLLFGLEGVSALFRSWLEVSRDSWRRRVAEALEGSFTRFDAADIGARRAALALLMLEPSHERAAQLLIRHYLATGNQARAISEFELFRDRLQSRYGIAPSRDTLALVEDLGPPEDPVSAALQPQKPRLRLPRISIGAFAVEGGDSGVGYLVQGFRSDLMANLARFRNWAVLEAEAPSDVTDDAGKPEYLVTARCVPMPAGHQLSVLLSEPASGRIIWSESFEMSVESWTEAQRRLVHRIAAHLEVYLSIDRLTRTITGAAAGSAYDDWLRGEHLLSQWDPAAEDQAADIFERLISRRPDFAPAFASLAGIYNVRHLIRPGLTLDARDERRALSLARRAVELDPLDARNHHTVAWTTAMAGEFEQSSVHYELATSLNRNSLRSLLSCAQGLAFIGAPERAAELLAEVQEMAPMLLDYQWCYVASTCYFTGDLEAGLAAAVRGGTATLDNPGWRAATLARLGRNEEAEAAFAEEVALIRSLWAGPDTPSPRNVLDWFLSAFPIRREHDLAELRKALTPLI